MLTTFLSILRFGAHSRRALTKQQKMLWYFCGYKESRTLCYAVLIGVVLNMLQRNSTLFFIYLIGGDQSLNKWEVDITSAR